MPEDGAASIGRWRICELLGAGGFAAVYRVERDPPSEVAAPLAAKVLLPEYAGSQMILSRLVDEARVMRHLDHPHVVALRELVSLDGNVSLLMELVEGVDLRTLVSLAGHLPPTPILHVMEAVAGALNYALHHVPEHGSAPLGLVHRDVKPANIVLTAAGGIKLLDFGISKANLGEPREKTRQGVFGTPGYMAPERLAGKPARPRTDVYALGITAVQALTGILPMEAPVDPGPYELWLADTLSLFDGRDVPPYVVRLISDMLAFKAMERPEAAQVAARCHAFLQQMGGGPLRDWAADVVGPIAAKRRLAPMSGPLSWRTVAARPLSVTSQPRLSESEIRPVVPPRPAPEVTVDEAGNPSPVRGAPPAAAEAPVRPAEEAPAPAEEPAPAPSAGAPSPSVGDPSPPIWMTAGAPPTPTTPVPAPKTAEPMPTSGPRPNQTPAWPPRNPVARATSHVVEPAASPFDVRPWAALAAGAAVFVAAVWWTTLPATAEHPFSAPLTRDGNVYTAPPEPPAPPAVVADDPAPTERASAERRPEAPKPKAVASIAAVPEVAPATSEPTPAPSQKVAPARAETLDPEVGCPMAIDVPPGTYTLRAQVQGDRSVKETMVLLGGHRYNVTCRPSGCASHDVGTFVGRTSQVTFRSGLLEGTLMGRDVSRCVASP